MLKNLSNKNPERLMRNTEINISHKSYEGNALMSALFIMSLIAITATMMMSRISSDIYQTERFIRTDKLYLASQLLPFWSMQQLQNDPLSFSENLKKEGFAITLPKRLQKLYPGYVLYGEIYDLQSRFNLNNLIQPQAQSALFRLIKAVNPNMNDNLIRMICSAAADWVSATPANSQEDKWGAYYHSLYPAYQASHQLFQSVSEFRLIAGVTDELFNKLAPYLSALPESTPININTALTPVLMSLSPGLTKDQVSEIIELRSQQKFQNAESLTPLINQYHLNANEFAYTSHYFMPVATVSDGKHDLMVYTVLKRKQDEQRKIWHVSLIRESFNTI